jgi:hypothetical protein
MMEEEKSEIEHHMDAFEIEQTNISYEETELTSWSCNVFPDLWCFDMCTANYSENPNHVEKPKFQMLSRKVSFADSDTETLLNSSSSRSNSPSKTAPEKPALSSKSPTLTASSEMKSPIHNRSQYKPRAGNSMPLLTQTAIDKLGKKHTAHYCAQATATAFRLRTGPNYSSRKLKVPSGEAFMELVGME